jgi:heterodisulfide reductase subunit A
VRAVLAEEPQEKVFAFACNWCSYAGGDMAGISRLAYPASNRVVRTMCSARVSEEMVSRSSAAGPVVLVSGCHYADCHYINANRQTVKRVQHLWDTLERAGVRPERLQLEWCSAAEAGSQVMRRLEELRRTVTAEEIAHAREALGRSRKRPRERWRYRGSHGHLETFHAWPGHQYQEGEKGEDKSVLPQCRSNSIRLLKHDTPKAAASES